MPSWTPDNPVVIGGATKASDFNSLWDNMLIGRDTSTGVINSIDAGGGVVAGDSVVTSLAGGTYPPVAANLVNLDSVTESDANYIRIRNVVFVSGTITCDPAAATLFTFTLTLPISTTMTADADCGGTFSGRNDSGYVISFGSDRTVALIAGKAAGTVAQTYSYAFSYVVK